MLAIYHIESSDSILDIPYEVNYQNTFLWWYSNTLRCIFWFLKCLENKALNVVKLNFMPALLELLIPKVWWETWDVQVSEAVSCSSSDDVPSLSSTLNISDATSSPCGGAAERCNAYKVGSEFTEYRCSDKKHIRTVTVCQPVGKLCVSAVKMTCRTERRVS